MTDYIDYLDRSVISDLHNMQPMQLDLRANNPFMQMDARNSFWSGRPYAEHNANARGALGRLACFAATQKCVEVTSPGRYKRLAQGYLPALIKRATDRIITTAPPSVWTQFEKLERRWLRGVDEAERHSHSCRLGISSELIAVLKKYDKRVLHA